MKVVANATPIIALSLVNRLDLLHLLFGEVFVPAVVYEEVTARRSDRPGASAAAAASWIRIKDPEATATIEPLLLGLDAGEMQVILLARDLQPDWVLMDERLGRRVAKAMGLAVKGTLGVLLAGCRAGFLPRVEARNALVQMIEGGIRIGERTALWFEQELDRP